MEAKKRLQVALDEEMRRSYLDYAMSVIIGRALPDVRDGFKPVHRRVFWAMHELGNTHNKPYKKSARVAGDCFVKGALVHTVTGLAPIEELDVGHQVQMPDGRVSRVVEVFHNPPAPVINVTFSNGHTMTVTPGQLFRVLHDDLSIGWERADNLIGKRVLVSSPRSLGFPEAHPSEKKTAAAYCVGLLVAEGYLADRDRSQRVGVTMTDKRPLEFLSAFCETQAVTPHWSGRAPQQPHHKPQHTLRFSGWAEAYAACEDTCAHKRVPDWVLSDRRLYAPFLAGFVDGDGSLRLEGSKREVVLASTSSLLLTQIQAMLADCGIHSHYTYEDFSEREYGKNWLPRSILCLTGANTTLFCCLVEEYLKVSRKRDSAINISKWDGRSLNADIECIPGDAIFTELSNHHLGAGWYQDTEGHKFRAGIKYPGGSKIRYSHDLREKTLSYRQIETWGILSKLERIGSPLAQRLKTLMDSYCVLDVESVEDKGELAETYDVQIEDGGHEFLVHGCAVHNCIGKFHPHGEAAVYETIVRLVQSFSIRYPLIDGQGNFGCFTGDTKIKLLDGTEKSFAELARLGPDEVFYVYSVDGNGQIVIGEGRNARITRRKARLIELTLDNGESIRCTPDHKFMLRDGTYKAARDLTADDSLMPGYFDTALVKDGLNEYLRVFQPATGDYKFVHHLADEFNERRGLARQVKGAFVRHHKNFNRWDNRPTNIERMGFLEHLRLHAQQIETLWEDGTFREVQRQGVQRYYQEHPEVLEERRHRLIRQNQDEAFRRKNGERVSAALKQHFQDNPEARAEISKRMKVLWEDPDYRAKMKVALSNVEKRELTPEEKARVAQIISEKSRAMWEDEAKRAEIVEAISRALAAEKVRAKMSAASQRNWQNPEYREKYPESHFSNMARVLWSNPATRERHRAKLLRQWQDQKFREVQRKSVQQSNVRRMHDNPQMMSNLAARAAEALVEKWADPAYRQQVMRQRIAGYVARLLAKMARADITPAVYETHRDANWIPRIETALKYFKDFDELLDVAQRYNHRIVSKCWSDERADVYDITVDRYHNFLLASGVFVHNSVDGDEPAAMRYCVTGDTLVVTDNGLVPISEISDGAEDIKGRVLSHGGRINTASKWFDSGVHPTYRVRTRHGYEVTGTANHPLLVWQADERNRPSFVWKMIGQLQPGDTLVIDRSEHLWPNQFVELDPYYPDLAAESRTQRHELPRVLHEDFAFLLGALTAEGTVRADCIEFTNTFGDFADGFLSAWKKVFPSCRLHLFQRSPSSYGKRPFWQMQIVSQQVVAFIRNLGVQGKSAMRRVPPVVLRSSQRVVAAFLRGLFEGDGCVERSGRSLLRVTLWSRSETLLQQVQTLLLRFGIVSRRYSHTRDGRQFYRLCIAGHRNLHQFAERIGFFSEAKQQAMKRVLTLCSGRALAKHDFIPLLAAYVRQHAAQHQSWLIRHNFDRPARLSSALPQLAVALRPPDYQLAEFLAHTNYLYDPIVSIESAGEQLVYSLRVDSQCHSFVANGFINHNTEVRLARIATAVLEDIEKDTVDFQPNYDESLQEPTVLPVRFPNLLVNGASGIAVGMATNIPPHNLSEIIDATIYLMQNSEATVEDLIKHVPGPDFPTGGFIYGRDGIKQAYETGRGMLVMRARAAIDRIGRGTSERDAIVVTEIPYQVNKAKLIEKIADLVNERKLEGIADLRDESDREGMRVVIELKRDAVPQVVLNKLYKLTPMQDTFGVINLAIVNGQPRVLNLKETLEQFILFRREVVRRRTTYDLNKAEARAHILEGLKRAIDHIDAIITLIRAAKSTQEARQGLMSQFEFTEKQAQAILDMQLQRLTGLERQKLVDEYREVIQKIAELKEILGNELVLRNVIISELREIQKGFGDGRRTHIVDEEVEFTLEDLIPDEEVVITATHSGFIKRTPLAVFRHQGRGGKGRYGMAVRGEDFVTHVFVATTHSYVMVFTAQGRVYNLKVHEIPDAEPASRGKAIANLAHISSDEKVAGIITIREFVDDKYVVMVTRKGIIKKTQLSEFDNLRASGLIAMSVDPDDELIATEVTDGRKKIFLATHDGKAIWFDESDVRAMGRQARGVRGIRLSKGDYVVSVCAVNGDEQMLSITEKGFGKQTPLVEYRFTSRGGQGVINVKTTERNGKVVAAMPLTTDDEVMIVTTQGKLLRIETSDIRETGRSAQGVKVITLGPDDEVAAASLVGKGQEEIEKAPEIQNPKSEI